MVQNDILLTTDMQAKSLSFCAIVVLDLKNEFHSNALRAWMHLAAILGCTENGDVYV